MQNLYKQFGYLFQTIRGSELTFYVNIQRLFEQSEHFFWEIRRIGLTCYIGTYKGCLSNWNILSEKLEALDSLAILEQVKVVWAIRTSLVRNQREALVSQAMFEHAKVFEQSEYSLWEKIRLTSYVAVWKDCLIDQNIPFEKLVDLDSPTMFKYVGTCKGCLTD